MSASFYIMTSKPGAPSTKLIDIGDERVLKVVAHEKGLAMSKKDVLDDYPAHYKLRLDLRAVKILNKFLDDIRNAAHECDQEILQKEFMLPLGNRYFVQIQPDVKCVSFRKFFHPKVNPSLLLPGFPGVSLKMSEFRALVTEWPELMESIPFHNAKCCSFESPEEHLESKCESCFF